MFHMILWLRSELQAAKENAALSQEIAHDALKRARFYEEHAARYNGQVNLLQARLAETIQGGTMVTHAVETLYRLFNGIDVENDMTNGERSQLERAMLQADMGFAIMNGVPFIDMTAETELESNGEETESEEL